MRNESKGGKPNRKPYHHYGFRNLQYAKKSTNEEKSSLFMEVIVLG
jgi:hypothetical protein